MSRKKTFLIPILVSMTTALSLCGCGGFSDLSAPSAEDSDSGSNPDPVFLAQSEETDGYSVRIFSSDNLNGHSFSDLCAFGDYLLLTGFTEDYSYDFVLYDPAEDRIVKELIPEEGTCDSYQILGDQLFAVDYDSSRVTIYDQDLNGVSIWDVSEIDDDHSLNFLSSQDSSICYCSNYMTSKVARIDPDAASVKDLSLNYYGTSLLALSPDGKYLVVSGIDQASLKNTISVVDTDTWETHLSVQGTSYCPVSVSGSGFLSEVNYLEDEWVYSGWDSPAVYFSFEEGDGGSAAFLDDSSFFTRTEMWNDYNDNQLTCVAYNTDGSRISAMRIRSSSDDSPLTLNFSGSAENADGSDNSSGSGETYLSYSSGYAYLPEYNCVLFLASENVYSEEEFDGDYGYDEEYFSDGEYGTGEEYSSGTEYDPESTYDPNGEDLSDGAASSPMVMRDAHLVIWDLSSDPAEITDAADFHDEPFSTESDLSLIPDPDSYDWGDLQECRNKASELEDTYGIELHIGPEIPASIDCYDCQQMTDPDVVMDALEQLEEIFQCYPVNFFPQLCYGNIESLQFYLAGDLGGSSEGMIDDPSAYVTNTDTSLIMVLDLNQSWDWDYTINHELSHMIDRRLDYRICYVTDSIYNDATWCSYNPSGFSYMGTYTGYESNPDYNYYSEYFVDSYGTTLATEDRAELFGRAMEIYLDDFDYYSIYDSGRPTEDKMKYYCKCIREGFNTEGWDAVMPWEEVVE